MYLGLSSVIPKIFRTCYGAYSEHNIEYIVAQLIMRKQIGIVVHIDI